MAVQKCNLVAALVQPREVPPRVHQVQHEQPNLLPLPRDLDGHLEEIHLRRVARTPDQRHEHFLPLPALLGQVGAHRRAAYLIPLLAELAMHQRPGDALLVGGAGTPLLQEFVDPPSYVLQHRPRPLRPRPLPRLAGFVDVLSHGVPAHLQVTGYLSDRQPFLVPLVSYKRIREPSPASFSPVQFDVQQHQTITRRVRLPGVGQFLSGKWLLSERRTQAPGLITIDELPVPLANWGVRSGRRWVVAGGRGWRGNDAAGR